MIVDDDWIIDRAERELGGALGNQITRLPVVEADLQLMKVAAEHLPVGVLQHDLVSGV